MCHVQMASGPPFGKGQLQFGTLGSTADERGRTFAAMADLALPTVAG